MIKPEMVPTCVAEKLRRMVYDFETNEYVLIAAALSAWPGMRDTSTEEGELHWQHHLILPLAQKQEDGDE